LTEPGCLGETLSSQRGALSSRSAAPTRPPAHLTGEQDGDHDVSDGEQQADPARDQVGDTKEDRVASQPRRGGEDDGLRGGG